MDAANLTPRQQLTTALKLHREGNLQAAEPLYRQALAREENADALHLLGLICRQTGRLPEALDLIRRAVALKPGVADFHYNLGLVLAESHRLEEAAAELRRVLQLRPDDPDTLCNLGAAMYTMQRYHEALPPLRRAVERAPEMRSAWHNLANVLLKLGQYPEAAGSFTRSIELQPDDPEEYNVLGVALAGALDIKGALAAYERAFSLKADFVDPLSNAAAALRSTGDLERAEKLLRRAVHIKPGYALGWSNLGNIVREWSRMGEALDCYRRAMELAPADPTPHSNLLYSMHFHPDCDAPAILRESRRFDEIHARPLTDKAPPHEINRDSARPLRIGYVSADFRDHVVGWNLLPMFRRHDRKQFQIFAYSNGSRTDEVTEKLKACCDGWREITALGDDKAAALIREDRIDILIDLSMHMSQNRILLFARKPAPVQATYLAYCSTTGLTAMDFRISDPFFDPPDSDASCYCETTIRLPKSYWCFQPIAEPPIQPAPCLANGFTTFGCLNSFAKVTLPALDTWAKILARCKSSRLILHTMTGPHRESVLSRLCAAGAVAAQIEFVGHQSWSDYIQTYNRIDIALDPFPYGGGITSLEALWMGVPIVTLRGRTAVGRGGTSLLSNLDLPELIAENEDQYIELAAQAERRIELRPTLRDRMKSSVLLDGGAFTRAMEAAYQIMWTQSAARP